MVNVYCVKWGTKYDRSFVENLKTSIEKLSLFQFTGDNLFFDLDIKINGDINFLADRFDTFTCIDSSPWKLHKIDRLEFRNDTLINTSIMRWTDSRKIFNDFIRKRDLYLRLYKGIDRYIYNEDIKYKTFQGTAISSWQEGIEDNTIVLYNNRYA